MQRPAPIPYGVRDLGVDDSLSVRALQRVCGEVFQRHGYLPVMTPMIEYLDVLRRGMYGEAERTAFKTVEPLTGEVAVLRPDITPQVARFVAQRLREVPRPVRLAYDGRILRLAEQGSEGSREIFQSGVELFGLSGAHGDVELLAVLVDALSAAQLKGWVCDLGHMGFLQAVFHEVGIELDEAAEVRRHLSRKNAEDLARVLRDEHGVRASGLTRLVGLVSLFGDAGVVEVARRTFAKGAARAALDSLDATLKLAEARGMSRHLTIDLGECRGFGYYTGFTLNVFVSGLGAPVASGGRYDNLPAVYGREEAAAGFAMDLLRLHEGVGATREGVTALGGTLVCAREGDAAVAMHEVEKLHARGERAAVYWSGKGASAQVQAQADAYRAVNGFATLRFVGGKTGAKGRTGAKQVSLTQTGSRNIQPNSNNGHNSNNSKNSKGKTR